jgi:hypothetical protein
MSNQQSSPPDHLLLLVQQVKAHYIETAVKSKVGRPRTYAELSFLLLAVVAVTLRTFRGLELHKLLAKDARLRSELGFAAVPHRTTIERRLGSLQAEAETQVAALGQEIVSALEPAAEVQVASAIDGRMYQARGPLWHHKQRKQGVIPLPLRNVDTESEWSKSGYRGWVQGYRLVLQTLLLPAPTPLFATWQPNNLYEEHLALEALQAGTLPVTSLMLGDSSFGSPVMVSAYARHGGWLLTPKQLPPIDRTWKRDLFALRKETIELLFQRIMQAVDLRDCPTKGLRRNGAFVIASVWLYQTIAWSTYKQGRPIAEVKETIDLARWRIAA